MRSSAITPGLGRSSSLCGGWRLLSVWDMRFGSGILHADFVVHPLTHDWFVPFVGVGPGLSVLTPQDGAFGTDVLNAASGSGVWIARPVDSSGANPLVPEQGDTGTRLMERPGYDPSTLDGGDEGPSAAVAARLEASGSTIRVSQLGR